MVNVNGSIGPTMLADRVIPKLHQSKGSPDCAAVELADDWVTGVHLLISLVPLFRESGQGVVTFWHPRHLLTSTSITRWPPARRGRVPSILEPGAIPRFSPPIPKPSDDGFWI